MITAEEKRGAKLTVNKMRLITRRSWSGLMDSWAEKMVNEAVTRSKADSDGLGLAAIETDSEQKLTP